MKKNSAKKTAAQPAKKTAAVKKNAVVKKQTVKTAPAKKAAAPAVKKAVPPVAKKAAAPAVKKAVPPAKKPVAPVAKKVAPAKKPVAPVAKKAAPVKKAAPAAKKATVPAVKKAVAPAKKAAPVAKKAESVKSVVPAEKETVKNTTHKKNKLTKAQKRHYISLLMELRRVFTSQQRFHQDEALTTKKDSAGERAGMATHMADLGSDNFRHDLELTLMTEEGDVLEMIDEALQKIEDNEYGICADCECLINPERLEAKPYARYCVRCKDLREKMEEPHRRHR